MAHRAQQLHRSHWEHSAPTCWPPPYPVREIRQIVRRTLPGVRYRRHLLWRFSLVWTKQ